MILNLGCGDRIVPNAINHDMIKHRAEVSIIHDLNITPWPWLANSVDEIQLISVAEHLELTLIETLNECWRILKPDGRLVIKYPIYSAHSIHDDPTHRWFWSDKALDFVDKSTRYGQVNDYYTPHKWQIKERGIIKERNLKAVLVPVK